MKVEYNEINIFAEFQLYNLIFAKNELLFDNTKAAVFLNLFWTLLEFSTDGPQNEEIEKEGSPYSKKKERYSRASNQSNSSPRRVNSDVNPIEYMGEGIESSSTIEV